MQVNSALNFVRVRTLPTSSDPPPKEVLALKTLDGAVEQETMPISVSERSIIKAIEQANKIMINHKTRAEFSVHEETKTIMVKIVDIQNEKILREFPPEKILDLIAKLLELAGIMVDERR